jgi:hypothetical protein
MPGIALNSAAKGRPRPSFFFLLTLFAGATLAQQPVYRCGQEYTNAPLDASRCERLSGQAVTVIPGTRVQAVGVAPAAVPAGQPPPAKVEVGQQKQRDDIARAIVLAELDKARQRHAALLRDHPREQGKTDDAQHKAAVDRARRDIDSLQRELDRRPPATAQP